jgi:kinetochore protein NNF1
MATSRDPTAASAAAAPADHDAIPPPPTTSVPGPRAQALQTAFARALEATLAKLSYDNFATCFPTAAAYKPSVLKDFHGSFASRLGEVCQDNFDNILAERDVVRSLNALDGLIIDAKERREHASAKGREVTVPVAWVYL